MNYLNYKFFDEFKKLDKLCKEIYDNSSQGKLGVTMYLEDMEAKGSHVHRLIPSWQADYNHLKRVRNIRNELAHGQTSFSYELCTQEDVDFVCNFYARVLRQNDPLALLHKQLSTPKPVYRPAQNPIPTYHPVINPTCNVTAKTEPNKSTKARHSGYLIATILILLVILLSLLAILHFFIY